MEGHFRSPSRIISDMKSSWENGEDSTSRGIYSTADTDAQPSVSSYNPYPSRQGFNNDTGYQAHIDRTAPTSVPESNRQAVMSALKGLQTKIRELELERGHAETNLKSLATETSRYRDLLNGTNTSTVQDESINNEQPNLTMQTQEVDGQLEAAESRCALLERQLDYMRQVVRQSDTLSPQRQATQPTHMDQEQRDLRAQIDKISELERDHLRLSATQSMSENKIRDLEDKLREERHYRKVCQERAAGLESQAESARILGPSTAGNIAKRPAKRKKKKVVKAKPDHAPAQSAREHYHLPETIPFITGKSVGESHSIPANVQRVLSMMKSHNNVLCSPRGHVRTSSARAPSTTPSCRSSDLNDLILQLQDEFGQMSFEHAELSRQMSSTSNQPLREDLERELDSLTLRMELKGEQIIKMRRHIDRLATDKKKKKKKCDSVRPYSATATTRVPTYGTVEVHTTIKSAGEVKTSKHVIPGSSHQAKNFLKNLKKIQTTLGQDDVSWECC